MVDMTSTPTALITGATQGLGLALASELDRRGWQLVLTGRDAGRIARPAGPDPVGHRRAG